MEGLPRLSKVVFGFIFIYLLALNACNVSQRQASPIHSSEKPVDLPTETNHPTSTFREPSKTPEPVPSATPTQLPTDTSTPVPSLTITPLATVSEKAVWVLFRRSGDAGMLMPKDYTGYFLPRLILFTDGQLIRMTDDDGLVEKVLSTPEMCEFLKALKNTGAFETQGNGDLYNEDPIYSGLNTEGFSDGSLFYHFTINGIPSKKYTIMYLARDYLIKEVKALVDLIENFKPEGLQTYQSDKNLLYITKDTDLIEALHFDEAPPQKWPKEMPKLQELIRNNQEIEVSISEEQVDLLRQYFPEVPGIVLFTQNEKNYTVALRPVLPGEPDTLFFYGPQEAIPFGLPFECEL